METRIVRLHVDVVVDGPVISGEVATGDGGHMRRFAGRPGLIAAIEQALDGPEDVAETVGS
jgi:hypothetical protein